MVLFDYIVNLAIFSLLVSTPLVIRSFFHHRSLKQLRLWAGLYAGLVSVLLVIMAVKQEGFTYDIRYAPVILVFAYLGPIPGIITGIFSLLTRLYSGGNWPPAIIGWSTIMIVFSALHFYISRLTPIKKSATFFGVYFMLYMGIIFTFHILIHEPLFHLQYILFVLLGVIIGSLQIESYEKLQRIIIEKKLVEKTLEASESQYRLIAENTSDLIMVLDNDYSVSYFSPSHECVLGYQAHELDCATLPDVVHPDDWEMFKSTVKRMFQDEVPHTMEFRFTHKEGHWIEFESRCRTVKDEEGDIRHIVMISRDITERKEAEKILLQSEKLSVVGELAAGVAHEIRNPLTTIKGFLQLYKKEDPRIKHSDMLLSELARIETITSELLTLGKPQAVQLSHTDVKELLEYTIEFLAPQANMLNIEFLREYEASSFPITGEKNQLKQVFLNILKNAMESMPDGGEIHIRLLKEREEECIIYINDQGCGVPEELLPRLGQPFYSLKERGTGLGLMICHRIIKQHQGSIVYRSKVNAGTSVEIRLPLTLT